MRWQDALKTAYRSSSELLDALNISSFPAEIELNDRSFGLLVTQSFANRMEPGNLNDPLLKQVLPTRSESTRSEGFTLAPLNEEEEAMVVPGCMHKYKGRVLVIPTGQCAINCRYCFRQHFAYDQHQLARHAESIINYIKKNEDIHEVIFSGGDPMLMSDSQWAQWIQKLEQIDHINILRIHSRVPIVLPERITDTFVNMFSSSRLKPVLVIHSNHPNELVPDVFKALAKTQQAQFTLLNQSVLLKGVNDSVDTLAALSIKLFEYNTLPYYLHCLDPVMGSQRFEIGKRDAKMIHTLLREQLPGYLVPKLVFESVGAKSKTWLI